jgi:hypothetical protein
VRIDRSYLTDEPGEDLRVRHARSGADDEDTIGKDECEAAPDRDQPTEAAAAADKPTKVADPDIRAETRSVNTV